LNTYRKPGILLVKWRITAARHIRNKGIVQERYKKNGQSSYSIWVSSSVCGSGIHFFSSTRIPNSAVVELVNAGDLWATNHWFLAGTWFDVFVSFGTAVRNIQKQLMARRIRNEAQKWERVRVNGNGCF